MPPNRKKKKPAANPARGFATVSIPSKPKVTESSESPSAEPPKTAPVSDRPAPAGGKQPQVQSKEETPSLQQYSPEELERHLEDSELQLLVEKYASKCKNDAARQAAKLETDRRVLRQQAVSLNLLEWMPSEVLDQILKLAETEEAELGPLLKKPSNGVKRSASQEELCVRLWTLKETLLKSGFPESKVDDALKYILFHFAGNATNANRDMVWNLDESLDWLAMHCSPDEMPSYTRTNAQLPKESENVSSWITDREPSRSSTPLSPQGDSKKAPKLSSAPKAPKILSGSPYDSDSSVDPDNFVTEFVDLQSRLYHLKPGLFNRSKKGKKSTNEDNRQVEEDPQVLKIQRKISKIENDVLFDRREAEYLWKEKLDEFRKEAVFSRSNAQESIPSASTTDPEQQGRLEETKAQSGANTLPADNIIEDEDVDLLGDMFETETPILDAIIESKSDTGVTLRDFGKWTGISPRRVLEETCKARDAGCTITYKDLSSSSYSNRKAIEVRWSKPQDVPFPLSVDMVTIKSNAYATFACMDTIATPTSQQAEGYISSLALFLLFSQSPKESKSYLRIPAVWREFWTELGSLRKAQEDEIDKKTVKSLKNMIEEDRHTFEDDVVLSDNFKKRNGTSAKPDISKSRTRDNHFSEEVLKKLWIDTSSTSSFQHMIQGRINLPIWGFKEDILRTLDAHRAVIICSETGSGKSTQVPSFILENELQHGRPCKIYVTEPRRISAISLARRVSEELGESKNDVGTARSLVGYAVRLESKVSQQTRLVYATTGVVVRMLERPENFQDISHVILDEVHERSIDGDFLLIVLRRLMQQRPDLKLVLMSATLEAQRFSSYLGGIPVLNIPGRTFPVEIKYLEDVIETTKYRLSEGNSSTLSEDDVEEAPAENTSSGGLLATLDHYSKQTKDMVLKFDEYRLDYQLIKVLLLKIASAPELAQYSKAILVFMPGLAEIRRLNDEILSEAAFQKGWVVYTLHSSIASDDQEKAFVVPPEGIRKIVIATNIAETGITIPDITAVVDAGREKTMRFDERRQLSRLVETFISRANAKQRRGRAGRVQNGICFHLFTKYRHDNLLAGQQTPEMLRLSLQDLVLRVKICKLGEVEQTLLEALDPPSPKNIRRAIDSLKEVKALTNAEALTPLGMQLAKLPLDVFLGKLIIYGCFFKCLDVCVSIAAIMSSKSPFVNVMGSNTQKELARLSFKKGDSDLLTVYNAYCSWKRTRSTHGANEYAFCRKNYLSPQTLLNIEDIKMQLLVSIADAGLISLDATQRAAFNRARYSGRQRQFFSIPEEYDLNSTNDVVVNSVIAWSFYPKLLTREGKGWRNIANNQTVTLHPTSVNKQSDSLVRWLSYYNIMQARNRAYQAHETSAVEDFAIALLCGDAEFKMYPGVISIDGSRIRFSVRNWKPMLALKILNSRMRDILSGTFRNPHKALSYRQQQWIEIWQQIFSRAGKRSLDSKRERKA